jgi:Xaa-Pro aminopeptidase
MRSAHLIYDSSERNVDLYYATRFRAPDAFLFFMYRGKKYLVLSDLEIDRARREAKVDEVLSLNPYLMRLMHLRKPRQSDLIHEVLSERRIRRLIVPMGTSFALVDGLRKRGYRVEAGPNPFFQERLTKTAEERCEIEKVQRAIFATAAMVRKTLAAASIRGRRLVWLGTPLTSEKLRAMASVYLMERGFVAHEMIISCGRHAIDPHDLGTGPLTPSSSIIVDIYPRSQKSFYYGDMTRTFCRGRAPEALRKMYAAVKRAQEMGIAMIRAGVNGRSIHNAIIAAFEKEGYHTGEQGGRHQGFIHGTGHGIGLDLHEEPVRIAHKDCVLEPGHVVSVEPGLYYKDIGGVRIEDLVYVTKRGCDVLAHYPKQLEIL